MGTAQLGETARPICGVKFTPTSAKSFAFNSMGAYSVCHGTGEVEHVNEAALIANPKKTIDEGAVAGRKAPCSFFLYNRL